MAEKDLAPLKRRLKELVVRELNLEGRDPATIVDDAPLFGEGLGLDSLDALQLAMAIEEQLEVRIPEGPDGRSAFTSIDSLAQFVATHQKSTTGAESAG